MRLLYGEAKERELSMCVRVDLVIGASGVIRERVNVTFSVVVCKYQRVVKNRNIFQISFGISFSVCVCMYICD